MEEEGEWKERQQERGSFSVVDGGGVVGGGEGEAGRGHIRLRDLQWLYISQCLVKAARQGSGNLIIA